MSVSGKIKAANPGHETVWPRVSIIVPVYNAEAFVARAIDAVERQSFRQWELILVDDGSSDGSLALCRARAAADSRIKVVTQSNRGPAGARNTGIGHAAGEWLFFLDADDFISADALENLLRGYEASRADMVLGNFCKLADGRQGGRQPVSFSLDNRSFCESEAVLTRVQIAGFVRHFLKYPSNHLVSYCWARLYRRELVERYGIRASDTMRLFEDFVFNLEYLRHAETIHFINAPLYVYVMHANHVSASMAIVNADSLLHDMRIFREKTAAYLAEQCPSANAAQEIGHALVHYLIIFIVRSCRQVTAGNRARIAAELGKLVAAPLVRENLAHYVPQPGNSRVLPLLMRLRAVSLMMLICNYKARRRYGKAA